MSSSDSAFSDSSSLNRKRKSFYKHGRHRGVAQMVAGSIPEETIPRKRKYTSGIYQPTPINEADYKFNVRYKGAIKDTGKDLFQQFILTPKNKHYKDFESFKANVTGDVIKLLKTKLKENTEYACKVSFSVLVRMEKEVISERKENNSQQPHTELISEEHVFKNDEPVNLLNRHKAEQIVSNELEKLKDKVDTFTHVGSGWRIGEVLECIVNYSFYRMIIGGNYIESPHSLVKGRAVVNVENKDNRCFEWAIRAWHHSAAIKKNKQRVAKYLPYCNPSHAEYKHLVWSDESRGIHIQFPVSIAQIDDFELLNPDYAIWVFGYDEKDKENPKSHLRTSEHHNRLYRVHLLMLQDREVRGDIAVCTNYHYCCIIDFNRFCGGGKDSASSRQYRCEYDYCSFSKQEDLDEHRERYCTKQAVMLQLPTKEEAVLEFEKFQSKQETPYYIVADLESINIAVAQCISCRVVSERKHIHSFSKEGIDFNICHSCFQAYDKNEEEIFIKFPPTSHPQTIVTHEQRACSAAFYVVNTFDPKKNKTVYIDVAENDNDLEGLGARFISTLFDVGVELKEAVKTNYCPLNLTKEEEKSFQNATKCHICMQTFGGAVKNRLWYKRIKAQADKLQFQEITYDMDPAMSMEVAKSNRMREQKLNGLETNKVRDHCHFTGKYRGAAHNCCNINHTYKNNRWKIPVFFHNMKNYDGHFLLQWLKDKEISLKKGKLFAIPQNKEKFLTISLGDFKFLDSFSFFNSSLRTLVEGMMGKNHSLIQKLQQYKELYKQIKTEGKSSSSRILSKLENTISAMENTIKQTDIQGRSRFTFLKQEFERDINKTVAGNDLETAFNMLFEKGHWAYEWFTSVEQLKQTSLPPREDYALKSAKINGEWIRVNDVDEEEYEKEQIKWKVFQMKSMRDAHDLYLKLDVILLADILENRRKQMFNDYGLDFTWFVSLPGYAWDAMLKTGFTMSENNPDAQVHPISLEIFSEEKADMYLFINKSIRGGMCMTPHRFSQANNKYMTHYVPSKPSSFLLYNDANQLYSWAMRQYLPYNEFEWNNNLSSFTEEFILQYDQDEKYPEQIGYVLDVDLEYPVHLHDYHSDYPLAPQPKVVEEKELSPYMSRVLKDLKLSYTAGTKLCSTLYDKTNYVVHYKSLQFYLKHGLRLKRVNKVLQFVQVPWIRNFIDFNVNKRNKANNDFDKDLSKLMNNAVYGKTMEDELNRIDFELVNRCEHKKNGRFHDLVRSPRFIETIAVAHNDNLVGISSKKTTAKLTKPKTTGFAVLELSKVLMYKYYYEGLKPIYRDHMHLCMTDTDSLETSIETDDLYMDMKNKISADIPFLHPSCPPQKACFANECDFTNYALPIQEGFNVVEEHFLRRYMDYYESIKRANSVKVHPGNVMLEWLNQSENERLLYLQPACGQQINHLGDQPTHILLPPTVLLYNENPHNSKVTGKFKDEEGGHQIVEFVGLKPKCYSNRCDDGSVSNKAKGIPKQMLKRKYITHQDYVDAIKEHKITRATFPKLQSKEHAMYFIEKTMVALTPFDSKRFVLDDRVTTRAFGHYRNNLLLQHIKEESEEKQEEAECQHDVDTWVALIKTDCIDLQSQQDPIFPDVDCTFKSSLSLLQLRNSMMLVPDGHVMYETLNTTDQYTGERDY